MQPLCYKVNRANLFQRRNFRHNVQSIRKRDVPTNIPKSLYQLKYPALFTISAIGVSYGTAAILQYEYVKNMISRQKNIFDRRSQPYSTRLYNYLSQFLSDGQITVLPIIAANVIIYCVWKLPSCQKFALKYLIAHPGSVNNSSMVLSVFSHYNPMHLFCNMFVLWSFSDVILHLFGKHQFYATYISGGIFANFGGHLMKVLRQSNSFSLGASGALMAMLGAVCILRPDDRLAIIFFPMFSFTAKSALIGLMSLDTLGLILKWNVFDHAAHLTGALFGVFYVTFGHHYLWDKREKLIKRWKQITSKK